MEKTKKINPVDFLAYGLIILFVIIFVALSFGRHDALKSYLNDIGLFDQVLWNTVHGEFFQYSAGMNNETFLFTSRFSLILFFFLPFYAVLATPKWLLFFQVLAVAGSAVPLYLFASEKLKNKKYALAFLVSFLFCPVLHNALLYDFHEVVVATFFSSWAFYFLEKEKDRWFILSIIFLAICQEFLALLVFSMGIYLIFIKKRRKFGLIVASVSLAYFVIISSIVMPHLSSSGSHGLLGEGSNYKSYYGWLGSSIPDIAKNIVTHPLMFPLIILKMITSYNRMKYLFILILPTFSLGIYSWPMIIALPVILLYFLSDNSMLYNTYFYHSAVIMPFVFYAAITTYRRWHEKWLWESISWRMLFISLIIFFGIGTGVYYGVTPISRYTKITDFVPSAHAIKIREVMKMIPNEATLSVQHNLGPHFTHRRFIYNFPQKSHEAQYVLVDETDPYVDNPRQLFGFDYAVQESLDLWKGEIEEMKKAPDYHLVYDQDGYKLFKRTN